MIVKKLLVVLACLPLLATKPAMRLDRYLKGKISLVSYLTHESALVYYQFLHQALLANGADIELVNTITQRGSEILLDEFPEDSIRDLFREDAPTSWVFAKKYFFQGRSNGITVVDHNEIYRLGRLVEGYGYIFPEQELQKAKTILSEIREVTSGYDPFVVSDSNDTKTAELAQQLDLLVYDMLLNYTDGRDFFYRLTELEERITFPMIDLGQEYHEVFVKIGAVVDELSLAMAKINEDVVEFDPNMREAVETYLSGTGIDTDRFIEFSLFHREFSSLTIRYFSNEFDINAFISHYRGLVDKHRQVYDSECLECVSSALALTHKIGGEAP